MFWPLVFACVLLLVVALKYFWPRGERCPQCSAPRDPDHPLCTSCGWIYEVPGDRDDDYGDPEDEEVRV